MSADHQFVLYHLMSSNPPRWEIGDEGSEPDGRILTYELEINQGSPHARESRQWKRKWINPDLNTLQADELEAKYPRPDRRSQLASVMSKFIR
jgi:hypothetical protein